MSNANQAPQTNTPVAAEPSVKPQNGKTGFDAFEDFAINDKEVKKTMGISNTVNKSQNRQVGDTFEDYADELTAKEMQKEENKKAHQVTEKKIDQPKEQQQQVQDKKEEAAIKKEIKRIKALLGEEAFEVPEDAEIEHPINGKMEKIKIKDALSDYSGRTEVARRFSEVDKVKKLVANDQNEIKEYVNGFREALKSENPLDAMNFMLDKIGIDTYDYKKKLFSEFAKEYNVLSEMSEKEQVAYWIEQENKHLKAKNEASIQKQQQEQAHRASALKLQQQREAAGISDEDYSSAEEGLRKANVPDITPHKIMEQAKSDKVVFKAAEMLNELDPKLVQDRDLVIEVAKLNAQFPDLTIQELSEALGISSQDVRVINQRTQDGNKTITNTEKINNNSVPLSWDDL